MTSHLQPYIFTASAWNDLSKLFEEVPPLGKLKGKVKELNSSFDIRPTPGDSSGAQVSLKAKLKEQVAQLLKDTPQDAPFR